MLMSRMASVVHGRVSVEMDKNTGLSDELKLLRDEQTTSKSELKKLRQHIEEISKRYQWALDKYETLQ